MSCAIRRRPPFHSPPSPLSPTLPSLLTLRLLCPTRRPALGNKLPRAEPLRTFPSPSPIRPFRRFHRNRRTKHKGRCSPVRCLPPFCSLSLPFSPRFLFAFMSPTFSIVFACHPDRVFVATGGTDGQPLRHRGRTTLSPLPIPPHSPPPWCHVLLRSVSFSVVSVSNPTPSPPLDC